MESFSFGNSPEMSEELLQLVASGKKTATSWAAAHGDCKTAVGEEMMITDYNGKQPRFVIETTELTLRKFNEVDEAFVQDEGEGDLSLGYWRKVHEEFFRVEGTFAPDMMLYCQRFKVVRVL